jgi:hypothetical protein
VNLKETCARAEVRAADLGRLLGITRISVHYWFEGKSNPNKYVAGKVEKIHRAILSAIDAGDLPLNVRPQNPIERTRAIGAIIIKHHKKKAA